MKTYPRTNLPMYSAEMKRRKRNKAIWTMGLQVLGYSSILVGSLAMLVMLISSPRNHSVQSVAPAAAESQEEVPAWYQDHSIHAYNLAADVVRETLRSPSTASFPGSLEKKSHVTKRTLSYGTEYKVQSWVDSQNGFGAIVRTKWTVYVVHDDIGWRVSAMDFIQK